jgi:hypothetical protein
LLVEAADHVAVAVAEHGRPDGILDALGEEERPAAFPQGAAREAERFESRLGPQSKVQRNQNAGAVLALKTTDRLPVGFVLMESGESIDSG